jgi:hypothetical protein
MNELETQSCEITYRKVRGIKVVQCFVDGLLFDESTKVHGTWYPIDTENGELYYDEPETIH